MILDNIIIILYNQGVMGMKYVSTEGETLSPEDEKLIDFCRKVRWGTFKVIVENGIPVAAEEIIRRVRFDN